MLGIVSRHGIGARMSILSVVSFHIIVSGENCTYIRIMPLIKNERIVLILLKHFLVHDCPLPGCVGVSVLINVRQKLNIYNPTISRLEAARGFTRLTSSNRSSWNLLLSPIAASFRVNETSPGHKVCIYNSQVSIWIAIHLRTCHASQSHLQSVRLCTREGEVRAAIPLR